MACFGNASADRVTQAQRKNNGQFLTTSYTSLYFILDKYHYSKAPSPGVYDCFVSCMFFGIDLPVKSE